MHVHSIGRVRIDVYNLNASPRTHIEYQIASEAGEVFYASMQQLYMERARFRSATCRYIPQAPCLMYDRSTRGARVECEFSGFWDFPFFSFQANKPVAFQWNFPWYFHILYITVEAWKCMWWRCDGRNSTVRFAWFILFDSEVWGWIETHAIDML